LQRQSGHVVLLSMDMATAAQGARPSSVNIMFAR